MSAISSLQGKKILLGITGGIAAYKTAELVRLLKLAGAQVKCVLTEGASHFVTAETLSVLSGEPVYQNLWEKDYQGLIAHIELARWADVILIAPASAHFIAKLTHGFADDLLTTVCLASKVSIVLAPAMNVAMWLNPATQSNMDTLQKRGIVFWGPDEGLQACGETGLGRMLEPETIFTRLKTYFQPAVFSNKKVLITAGPTLEPLDPVRYLSNHSSGKMGYALAKAFHDAGAEVVLISGKTHLDSPEGIQKIEVTTAQEMAEAVHKLIQPMDIFISAAAVCDYRPKVKASQKIKKTAKQILTLELIKNPDIVAAVAKKANTKKNLVVIGFAAETNHLKENALKKLKEKKLDMIIANDVSDNKVFYADSNEVWVLTQNFSKKLERLSKLDLAIKLVDIINKKFF